MAPWLRFAAILSIAGLAACAGQPDAPDADLPGLFIGVWHGLIVPIALLAGLFSDIRIYAFPNEGFLYDLGFVIGLSGWGFLSHAPHSKRRKGKRASHRDGRARGSEGRDSRSPRLDPAAVDDVALAGHA